MATYKVQIDDLVRDATADEIAEIEAREAAFIAEQKAEADRAKAKADVLAKLGLTADEVAALLS
jgi:hypothetical protein